MKTRRLREMEQLRIQLMTLTRRLRREAQSDDRSWARLLVLGAIDRHNGNATPSQLAATENMQSSNLAAALRELEADELIVRTPDIEDRRKVRVQVTRAGRQLLEESRTRRDTWLAKAVETSLSGEERQQLLDAGALLERIARYDPLDY
jgi:DNA-binding MarR family transcriptional regulator